MAFAYAGYPVFMGSFLDKFKEEICRPEWQGLLTTTMVRDIIITVLSSFDANDSASTHLLCAVAIPNTEIKLYRTQGTVLREESGYACVGVGESALLEYLIPCLSGSGIKDTRQAALIATSLIHSAKEYIDGCGGDTDIWILRPSGALEQHSHLTLAAQRRMGLVETRMSWLASRVLAQEILR